MFYHFIVGICAVGVGCFKVSLLCTYLQNTKFRTIQCQGICRKYKIINQAIVAIFFEVITIQCQGVCRKCKIINQTIVAILFKVTTVFQGAVVSYEHLADCNGHVWKICKSKAVSPRETIKMLV